MVAVNERDLAGQLLKILRKLAVFIGIAEMKLNIPEDDQKIVLFCVFDVIIKRIDISVAVNVTYKVDHNALPLTERVSFLAKRSSRYCSMLSIFSSLSVAESPT